MASDYYHHAMLGVAGPAVGTSLEYRATRYYFVEMTNKNRTIGELPGECSDTSKWYVVPVGK